jgi:ribosomal protein L40E
MIPRYIEQYRDQSLAYTTSNPEGRLHVVCPQCRAMVLLCDSLSRTERKKVASLERSDSPAALEHLKTMLPCGETEAKAIVAHLRRDDEGCRRCAAEMPRGALLCAHCMSVNLDWS